MKRQRNYEKGSPFKQTISEREPTGDGVARPTLRPNKPANAGKLPLILTGATKIVDLMRANELPKRQKKTGVYKARCGRIMRRCGSQRGFKI